MTDIEDEHYTPENVFKLILMIAAIPVALWLLFFLWDSFHDYFTAYYDVYALAYGRTE